MVYRKRAYALRQIMLYFWIFYWCLSVDRRARRMRMEGREFSGSAFRQPQSMMALCVGVMRNEKNV